MNKKKSTWRLLLEYLMLAVGSTIAAFAIEEFLVPCTILDGGVVGIGIMVNNLTGVSLSILTIAMNIPFLIASAGKLGKQFISKSAFSMVVFSVAVNFFAPLENATEDYLLAVCFGGVVLGAGVGLVIRFGGCLDGTETVAILLNKKFKYPVGRTVLFINVVIYTVAGFLFGFDRAMYSLLTYFITSRILDLIEHGMDEAKAAMIITDDATMVAEKIYKKLGRTVTVMHGEGLVSGEKSILYCVLTKFEIHELKNIIDSIDSSAFVAVSDVSEIIGNHVKRTENISTLKGKTIARENITEETRNDMFQKIYSVIPGTINNSLVIGAFETMRKEQKVERKLHQQNFEKNRRKNEKNIKNHEAEITAQKGFVENQNAYTDMAYGVSTMQYSGCEIFAVYNAMKALDAANLSLPEMISDFEKDGMVYSGKFGTAPKAMLDYLLQKGYRAEMTTKEEKFEDYSKEYETLILTFYNDRNDLGKGVHTIAITGENGRLIAHNVHCNGKLPESMNSMTELLEHLNWGKAKGICLIGANKKM